ncbi:MAG: hypothetical protein AAF787_06365 [Chloroflexota bacterium]
MEHAKRTGKPRQKPVVHKPAKAETASEDLLMQLQRTYGNQAVIQMLRDNQLSPDIASSLNATIGAQKTLQLLRNQAIQREGDEEEEGVPVTMMGMAGADPVFPAEGDAEGAQPVTMMGMAGLEEEEGK